MEALAWMAQALVITLREGIEAALIIVIVLSFLRKTGREELNKHVYRGLFGAVGASLAAAIIFTGLGIDPENEALEGAFMLAAAILVGSLVIWMWRTGHQLKGKMERRLESLSRQRGSWMGAFGLGAFTFFMVLREGIETVLFLAALTVSIGANPMYNALGGSLGLALAVLFGVLFIKGSIRIDLGRFFSLTGIVLLLLVVKLIANALHEFAEAGLMPTNESVMGLIGVLSRESSSILILMAIIALPGILMLWEALHMREEEGPGGAPSPERGKARAQFLSARRWTLAGAIGALSIAFFLVFFLIAKAGSRYDPPPLPMEPKDGALRVPPAMLEEGKIRKFSVRAGGREVRFFMIKKGGTIYSALDRCNICSPKGYVQKGEKLICLVCGAPIRVASIGMPGGCNPIPLKFQAEGEKVLIQTSDLVAPG